MDKSNFEELKIYQSAEQLSDKLWDTIIGWEAFAKFTIGKQLIRSVDSIGANIAEGSGRGSYIDNRRFIKIARGSLFESKHWLKRAFKRKLINIVQMDEINILVNELTPKISGYINYLNKMAKL